MCNMFKKAKACFTQFEEEREACPQWLPCKSTCTYLDIEMSFAEIKAGMRACQEEIIVAGAGAHTCVFWLCMCVSRDSAMHVWLNMHLNACA